MSYTDDIEYFSCPELFDDGAQVFEVPPPGNTRRSDTLVFERANSVFSHDHYLTPEKPIRLCKWTTGFPGRQEYVLRLLIREPYGPYVLPERLGYLRDFIQRCAAYQAWMFPSYDSRFAYLTVRHGHISSVKDDILHVDGFQGASIPRHIPDQNYIWSNRYPTLFSSQPFDIRGLDPAKYDAHKFFQNHEEAEYITQADESTIYLIDPYHVHKRPDVRRHFDGQRSFLRLSFLAVEIRDNTNTMNPWLLRGPWDREDVRNHLLDPGMEDMSGDS